MKKILLMSVIALSLVGASCCSNNSNSTNNSSAKSSKTTQKKHWDKKKDQKLAKEMDKYGKKKSQPIPNMMVKTSFLLQQIVFIQMPLRKILLS